MFTSPRLCRLSPSGEHIASAQNKALQIQAFVNGETTFRIQCCDDIQALNWSPDSELVAASIFKRASVEVSITATLCSYFSCPIVPYVDI
jgi:hypothetical protein